MFSSQTGIQNLSFSAWMSSRTALRTDSSWWRLLAFVFLVFESSLFREFVFSFCTGICVSIFLHRFLVVRHPLVISNSAPQLSSRVEGFLFLPLSILIGFCGTEYLCCAFRVSLRPLQSRSDWSLRATPPVLSMWPCKLNLDKKIKTFWFGSAKWFWPSNFSVCWGWQKAQQSLTLAVDCLDSLIGPGGFLLEVSCHF
jgi:hypothetical protein